MVSMADTLTARLAPASLTPAVPSPLTFDAIATRWCVDTDVPLRGEVRDQIRNRIRRFDRAYYRFRPDSLVFQVAAATVSPSSRRSRYADGTYNATGQYGGLPSSIRVSVTLVDDVITAVTVTPQATDPTSLVYQTRFAEAVPALVVGRNIDEVNLSKVAGSSGTPDGFNAAIQLIKAEATT
jgi:uncharacterized protein with FMN-binding domain